MEDVIVKYKRNLKKFIKDNEKDAKDYIKKTKAKEQEDIKSLMDIIICENKEALNELAK